MFGNNDFGFIGFVAEATSASKNKIILNKYERLLEINDYADAFFVLSSRLKNLLVC